MSSRRRVRKQVFVFVAQKKNSLLISDISRSLSYKMAFCCLPPVSSSSDSAALFLPLIALHKHSKKEVENHVMEWVKQTLRPLLPVVHDCVLTWSHYNNDYNDNVEYGVWMVIFFSLAAARTQVSCCFSICLLLRRKKSLFSASLWETTVRLGLFGWLKCTTCVALNMDKRPDDLFWLGSPQRF